MREYISKKEDYVHLLVVLEVHYKFRDVKDIERVVFAEIPDPNHDSTLYKI
jgi:hypothetical protein